MSSRDLRFARTRSRAHTRAKRKTTDTCIGPFAYFRVQRCAAPCAGRAATAQIARSRRDLAIAPRNLGLKPSLSRTPSCPGARAGGETTATCIGPFAYFRVVRCAAPCAGRAATAQIARSRRDLAIAPRNLGLKPSLARTPSCPDARAGRERETTPTCIGPFVYFRVLRCAAPWASCCKTTATPL